MKLKWLCAIVVIIGVATVIAQMTVILTVNGIVGYSQVSAVKGAVMPTASVQCYSLDFYKAHLKGEYPVRPSLPERMLTAGGLFEMPGQSSTQRSESGPVPDTADSPTA